MILSHILSVSDSYTYAARTNCCRFPLLTTGVFHVEEAVLELRIQSQLVLTVSLPVPVLLCLLSLSRSQPLLPSTLWTSDDRSLPPQRTSVSPPLPSPSTAHGDFSTDLCCILTPVFGYRDHQRCTHVSVSVRVYLSACVCMCAAVCVFVRALDLRGSDTRGTDGACAASCCHGLEPVTEPGPHQRVYNGGGGV